MNIKIVMLTMFTLAVQSILAQNTFKAIIKDEKSKEVLIGVNAILGQTTKGASSDENGDNN